MRIVGATIMHESPGAWEGFVQHIKDFALGGWVVWDPGNSPNARKYSELRGARIVEDFRVYDERPFADEDAIVAHSLYRAAIEDLNADAVMFLYPGEKIIESEVSGVLDLDGKDVQVARVWRQQPVEGDAKYEPEYGHKVLLVRACDHFSFVTPHGYWPLGAMSMNFAGNVSTQLFRAEDGWGKSAYGRELITKDEFDEKGIFLWQQARK